MSNIKTTIEAGPSGQKQIVIRADIPDDLPLSQTGKSRILTSSGGLTKTDTEFAGRPVTFSLIAFVPKD